MNTPRNYDRFLVESSTKAYVFCMKIGRRIHPRVLAFLAVFALCSVSLSEAGERIGNGGGAWACVLPSGSFDWVRMVDLYEAETEFHFTIERRTASPGAQAKLALQRLASADPKYAGELSQWLDHVLTHVTSVRAELQVIDDFLYHLKPYARECPNGKIEYVQTANFTSDGSILFREDVVNLFDDTMKAALYLHEAVYADLRFKYGEQNSIRARHLTALLMSTLNGQALKVELNSILGTTPIATAPRPIRFVKIPKGVYTIGGNGAWRSYALMQDLEISETAVTDWQFAQVTGNYNQEQRQLCPHNFVITRTTPYVVGYCPNRLHVFYDSNLDQFTNAMTLADPSGKYRYRIPTLEEWEIASRAGTQTKFFFGSDPSEIQQYAVVSGREYERKSWTDVATKRPNGFGIYDAIGNYWELVATQTQFGARPFPVGCNFNSKIYDDCVSYKPLNFEHKEGGARLVRFPTAN